jgi:hypothetical protein
MHTLIVCLMIVGLALVAAITVIICTNHTVPNGLYITLSSTVTGLIGVHVGQSATTAKS